MVHESLERGPYYGEIKNVETDNTAERKKTGGGFAKKLAAVCLAVTLFGVSLGFGIGAGAGYMSGGKAAGGGDQYIAEGDGQEGGEPGLIGEYVQTSALAERLGSLSDVYKSVGDAVVSVSAVREVNYFGRRQEVTSAGSGIIFREDSSKIYIVTNYHVVGDAKSVAISVDDTNAVPAQAVGGDPRSDIAVISVLKSNLQSKGIKNYKLAKFGDSSKMQIGDFVMAIGNALGEGKSATFGVISTERKRITVDDVSLDVFQTDAAINRGNSGGALVNMSGEVIGINSAKLEGTGVEGMGYAIPSEVFVKVVERIMSEGSDQGSYLGISYDYITNAMKESLLLPTTGFRIASVVHGATAHAAGIRSGDIITHINGRLLSNENALKSAIDSIKVGEQFTVTVQRRVNNRYSEQTFDARMQSYPVNMNF